MMSYERPVGRTLKLQSIGVRNREKLVRVPGFEPGFRRWQRPVITTTLHSCEIRETRLTFLSVGCLSREPL